MGTRTSLWGRLAALALVAAAVVVTAILLRRPYAFIDLGVYEWAAREAFSSSQLYDATQPGTGLRFTYPPFAALAFHVLDAAGMLGRVAFTVVSLLSLVRTCWLLAAHRGALLPGWSRGWVTVVLAAGTVLVEPGGATLMLGQVSFLLLWLVVEGALGPLGARAVGGVGAGLATALKLTPAVYVVQLALAGRWRQLGVAVGTVVTTIVLGAALLPAASRAFWSGAGTDADRVGAIEYVTNQSINGVLWRMLGPGGSTPAWIVLGIVLGGACLLLARRYDLADERASALGLAGLAGLLASPVSWTHHWVAVLPLVVGLLGTARRRRQVVASTLAVCVVLGSRLVLQVPQQEGREFAHTPIELVVSSSYLLCALLLIVAAWRARPVSPRS